MYTANPCDFQTIKEILMKVEYDAQTARETFRTALPGLSAVLVETGERYAVHDLSAGGLNIMTTDAPPRFGARIVLDLYLGDRLFLKNLTAELVRLVENMAAYAFIHLNRVQERRLDKLVLTMQKQQIARGELR
jgi:c-di-GMP-binding flagellar brake protein YcgR